MPSLEGTRKDSSSSSKERKNLVRFLWSIVCIQALKCPGAAWCLLGVETSVTSHAQTEKKYSNWEG